MGSTCSQRSGTDLAMVSLKLDRTEPTLRKHNMSNPQFCTVVIGGSEYPHHQRDIHLGKGQFAGSFTCQKAWPQSQFCHLPVGKLCNLSEPQSPDL